MSMSGGFSLFFILLYAMREDRLSRIDGVENPRGLEAVVPCQQTNLQVLARSGPEEVLPEGSRSHSLARAK